MAAHPSAEWLAEQQALTRRLQAVASGLEEADSEDEDTLAFYDHDGAGAGAQGAGSSAAAAAAAAAEEDYVSLLPPAFQSLVATMPHVVRRLLLHNVDPDDVPVDFLLDSLAKPSSATEAGVTKEAREADVLEMTQLLSPTACAALRRAVDEQQSLDMDSVDDGPTHQLLLTRSALEALLGPTECASLFRAPLAFRQWRRRRQVAAAFASGGADAQASEMAAAMEAAALADADAAAEAETEAVALRECFIRRYSPETRPFIGFHPDAYELTVNVALSDDAAHGGGRLLGVFDGKVRRLMRGEGGATVHSSQLLHAVSRMTSGVRYSLICFFDRTGAARRHAKGLVIDET